MTQPVIYKDNAGEWRWRILADNGRIIAASSEGYKQYAGARANLDMVTSRRASAVVLGVSMLAAGALILAVSLLCGCVTLPDALPWPQATNAAPQGVTNALPPATSGATTNGDAIALGSVKFAYAGAAVVAQASNARISGGKVSWTDNRPASWPRKGVKVEVDGIACMAVVRDGAVIVAGKYDWTRPNQRTKGLENVHAEYGVFKGDLRPRAGDRVSVCVVSVDGRERTTWSEPAEYR